MEYRTVGHQAWGDRIFLKETEHGWTASQAGSWIDGFYENEEAARIALEFSYRQRKPLRRIWENEHRAIRLAEVRDLEQSQKLPLVLRIRTVQRLLYWLDRNLPSRLKPKSWG